MRIISGKHKGKRLHAPPDAKTTRPIPDRVKESLFNLLRGHYEGAHVVDLFAGTGSIGLEAYSRGAARVLLVERDKKIARVLNENVESLGRPAECEVFIGDALGPLVPPRCPTPISLLVADPPYALVRDPGGWRRMREQFSRLIDMMSHEGFAVLRTPWPFVHRVEKEREHGRDARATDEREPRTVVLDLDEMGDEELDALEAELMQASGQAGAVEVDLSFDNAEGPETHAYGSTAVHLYMRKKPEDQGGSPG